ncbi:hypothetical protein [Winogradskyella sp. PC D3.3]
MKKRIFSLTAVVVLVGSSMNLNAHQNVIAQEDSASCFEQAHYFADWIGSMFEMNALDRLDLILDYTEQCENQN